LTTREIPSGVAPQTGHEFHESPGIFFVAKTAGQIRTIQGQRLGLLTAGGPAGGADAAPVFGGSGLISGI